MTVIFLIGTGHLNDAETDEIHKSKDILQVDVYDNYENLVYKLLAAYRWIGLNHPDKFVVKMDADVVMLPDRIINRVGLADEHTMQCYVIEKKKIIRDASKNWYIPESIYPGLYLPNYCCGATYLMSPKTLSLILDASKGAEVIEVEDFFFTGILARKVGVNVKVERGIWYRWKYSQPCVNGEATVISHPVEDLSSSALEESWKHLSHIRCRWPIEHFVLSMIVQD
ncbi:N-acetyllactosaminide 3-alpha-galactosyltransferase [Dictyocaulus viviparus]|uniref:Hexosyltransferase n=1 Tax=Dictyocaulus viviparus TaxID=29172 RepID=A0A0D8XHR3_DICVI|nr:N-acetyllactosaminide 3-alpha-galactosyltransferase [Dictyocaulus viviparus]